MNAPRGTVAVYCALLLSCDQPTARLGHANAPAIERQSKRSLTTHDPQYWIDDCNSGNGETCSLVGWSYKKGGSDSWGYFPQDDAKAASFFAKGCRLGHPQGCGELGHAYLKGVGVGVDQVRGANLVVLACDKGYAFSCHEAGIVLYDGTGVERDQKRALTALVRGCANGAPLACDLKAHLFGDGGMSKTDPPDGAVGVKFFGTPLAEIQGRCRAASNSWKGDATGGYCSGAISSTVPLPFMAFACDGQACAINVIQALPIDAIGSWITKFDEFDKRLETRYGVPNERIRTLPAACDSVSALPDCLTGHVVVYSTTWIWETGFGVLLKMTNDRPGPQIQVYYSDPRGFHSQQAQGL